MADVTEIGPVTNGAASSIVASMPYMARVVITGTADLLFHRWNVEGVEAKSKAAKNSAAKKQDDLDSYVYRDEEKFICLPGEYLRQSAIQAAKFRQDPRSPRKSAMDLYKAGIVSLTLFARICTAARTPHKVGDGNYTSEWDYEHRERYAFNLPPQAEVKYKSDWDYEHKARVQVQRNGVTRTRPAFKVGWTAEIHFLINLPEYISPADFHEVLNQAGRLVGVGDFRPSYGRFLVSSFEVMNPE